ncbi:hypothetical protein CISIN_1g0363801mg, partial [Citrus sinensis]
EFKGHENELELVRFLLKNGHGDHLEDNEVSEIIFSVILKFL